MIKVINFVFMLLSLTVIIALGYTLNNILGTVSSIFGNMISVEEFREIISSGTREEIVAAIAIVGSSIFTIFGFPVTIFLVSLNGLKK